MIEFGSQNLGEGDRPLWNKDQFLDISLSSGPLLPDSHIQVLINQTNYISQLSNNNFVEFGELNASPGSKEMRKNGCGAACLYMALKTLDERKSDFSNVGFLALQLLILHRNDRVNLDESKTRGTPVFRPDVGWYHDALAYYAINESGLNAYRKVGLNIDQIGIEMFKINKEESCGVCIVSVKNKFWRSHDEPESSSSHLIVVNGCKVDKEGGLEKILITDPYTIGRDKLNVWIDVDERVRNSIAGSAIFIYSNNAED